MLEKVFRKRVERAAKMLSAPQTGPNYIRFTSANLSDPKALQDIHLQFPDAKTAKHYLYQVMFENQEGQIFSHARTVFRDERSNRSRNMSRDNVAHPDSKFLYVGTSQNMRNRFRSHLGIGKGKSTWGLYLSVWAAQIGATFLVEYYEFNESLSEDIELVEGVLWDSLQPLFGKKGGK